MTRLRAATVCVWIAILLASARPARAQVDRGELRLRVVDPVGQVLPGAAGTLISEAPAFSRAFSTDAQGTVTLADLPFGVYRLTINLAGFVTRSQVVEVHSAVPSSLQIALELGIAVVETVSEPLIDTRLTGVVFSIGTPAIQDKLPAVPGRQLLELVDAQPGWLMEANGVLHPRGSEYQTLFVVDGIPMDENRSPAFAPDLQESDLQAVAVLTGNFPAEYGRKLGGVVEVTTAQDIKQGFHGAADLGGGSFGTIVGSMTAGYGGRRRAVTISGSAARTNRYLDPPVVENYTNDGSLGGVSASYDDRPSDADRLRITWHRRGTNFQVPNERVQQAAGQRQKRVGREDLGQASWTRVIGSRSVFNARGMAERLVATLESNAQATPIIVSQDRSLRRGYANASLAADLGRHHIKFGGDIVFAPVRESLLFRITNRSAFEPDVSPSFAFADRRNDREQSAFAQDTIRVGAITASAGIRWDRYALVVSDSAASPRLGVAWSVTDDTVLRASYDRVFQTPAVENLLLASSPAVDVAGSAVRLPVRPSRGNFVEAGVTSAIGRAARVDITAYRRTVSQFADDDVFLNTGVSFPVAFDAATIRGIDAKLTVLHRRRASGFVTYSLLKGTARLPVVGGLFLGEDALAALEAQGDVAITQDQRHTVRGQIRVDAGERAWVAASMRYGSGLPVEMDESIDEDQFDEAVLERIDFARGRVGPNFAIDLGAAVKLWRGERRSATLRGEIANLTDRVNVINFAGLFSGTAIAAPRSGTVRLRVEF